jgi:integrase
VTEHIGHAATFVHDLAGLPSPTSSPIVEVVRESAKRELGFKRQQKAPLTQSHIQQLFRLLAAGDDSSLLNVTFLLCLALMSEACLRWDDLQGLTFGDLLITPDIVRIFITGAKTDRFRDGQWATFLQREEPWSAYQLLGRVLHQLLASWKLLPPALRRSLNCEDSESLHLTNIPILFRADPSSPLYAFPNLRAPKISYWEFLHGVKSACACIGLDPAAFGTHSLRIGHVADGVDGGIPDRVIKQAGRWRSEACFEGYIADEVALRSHVNAYRRLHGQCTSHWTGHRSYTPSKSE